MGRSRAGAVYSLALGSTFHSSFSPHSLHCGHSGPCAASPASWKYLEWFRCPASRLHLQPFLHQTLQSLHPLHHTGRFVTAVGSTNKSSLEPLPWRKAFLFLTVNVCSPNLHGGALPVPAGGVRKWVVPGLASWRRRGAWNAALALGARGAA